MFLLATLDLPNLWHSALPPTKSHPRHQKMTPKRMSTATGRVYSWKKPMRTSVWYGFGMAFAWEFVHRKTPEIPEFPAAVVLPPKNWGDFQWFRVEKQKNPGPIRWFAHSPVFLLRAACPSSSSTEWRYNWAIFEMAMDQNQSPAVNLEHAGSGCLFRHSIWNNRCWPIPHVE